MRGRRGTQRRPDLNTGRWKRIRQTILDRDGKVCQIGAPGCLGDANTVDHIVPWAHGGDDHPDNLRAACRPCNSSLGAGGRSLTSRRHPSPPQHRLSPHGGPTAPTRGVWHLDLPA